MSLSNLLLCMQNFHRLTKKFHQNLTKLQQNFQRFYLVQLQGCMVPNLKSIFVRWHGSTNPDLHHKPQEESYPNRCFWKHISPAHYNPCTRNLIRGNNLKVLTLETIFSSSMWNFIHVIDDLITWRLSCIAGIHEICVDVQNLCLHWINPATPKTHLICRVNLNRFFISF